MKKREESYMCGGGAERSCTERGMKWRESARKGKNPYIESESFHKVVITRSGLSIYYPIEIAILIRYTLI